MDVSVRPATEEDLYQPPTVKRCCGQNRQKKVTTTLEQHQAYWTRQGFETPDKCDIFGIKKLTPKPEE